MAKILIVDNQSFFAKALAADLQALGHGFAHAENVNRAREVLENEDFDAVAVDGKMTNRAGAEFAKWVRINKPTPLVMMADFADQADPKAPFNLAGVTLLVKPFNTDAVRAALTAAIPAARLNAPRESTLPALVSIPKNSLKMAGLAEFNLYHYVDGHPRKILARGESYIYVNLPVPANTRFYTDKESLDAVLEGSLRAADRAVRHTKIAAERKSELMQNALQVANEQLALIGLDAATAEATGEILTAYMKSFDENSLWQMLGDLDSYSRPIFAQTLASTIICVLIAQQQNMNTQDTFKLMTAAMFHDVGMTTLDPRLIQTPRALLSMKDRQALDRHVEIGVSILQKTGWVTAEVCNIVWQHHENDTGTGFPRALKAAQIHPMARILRVADEFSLSVMKSVGQRGIPPLRAVELLKDKRELDQKIVQALHRALTVAQPA